MTATFTNSKESLAEARHDTTDWKALTRQEQIRSMELDGFVVLPDLLYPETLDTIREELERLPAKAVDYSPHQRTFSNVQWTDSPAAIETIAHPRMIEFLSDLFGDALICTSCSYTCSHPGHPGIVIHTDSDPYGSKMFGAKPALPYWLGSFTIWTI